jgi:SAM-dependent methyltransferase
MPADRWQDADAYERFIGRWSRRAADQFLAWLSLPAGATWVDVGCGTGALAGQIVARTDPARVTGVDPSAAFVEAARDRVAQPVAAFEVGQADRLPLGTGSADVVVSGLVLNFVPDVPAALDEAARVARPGGTVAAYVWDYAGRMELLRRFWDAAVELDPSAAELDEGRRFPIAAPAPLATAWVDAGLGEVLIAPLDVPTRFADFDDLWLPFTVPIGPAPGYVATLPPDHRDALRERMRSTLPIGPEGTIDLIARAWAIRGRTPGRVA